MSNGKGGRGREGTGTRNNAVSCASVIQTPLFPSGGDQREKRWQVEKFVTLFFRYPQCGQARPSGGGQIARIHHAAEVGGSQRAGGGKNEEEV